MKVSNLSAHHHHHHHMLAEIIHSFQWKKNKRNSIFHWVCVCASVTIWDRKTRAAMKYPRIRVFFLFKEFRNDDGDSIILCVCMGDWNHWILKTWIWKAFVKRKNEIFFAFQLRFIQSSVNRIDNAKRYSVRQQIKELTIITNNFCFLPLFKESEKEKKSKENWTNQQKKIVNSRQYNNKWRKEKTKSKSKNDIKWAIIGSQ